VRVGFIVIVVPRRRRFGDGLHLVTALRHDFTEIRTMPVSRTVQAPSA